MAIGDGGPEPTLLIKSTSLSLRYALKRQSLRFYLTRVGNKVLYAVEIPDDPSAPGTAWSLVGLPAELTALRTLISSPRCVVFLFNELAISVAWAVVELRIDSSFDDLLASAELHPPKDQDFPLGVSAALESAQAGIGEAAQAIELPKIEWHELKATYIKNSFGNSSLSLFHTDEGGQQEEVAVWLVDNLHPGGCFKSPFAQTAPPRELTDLLLTHEYGPVLVESKALAILTRDNLPDRTKLAADLEKHVRKAANQLMGGVRTLKSGIAITDELGNEITVEREKPAHAIILVPDLSLLSKSTQLDRDFVVRFMERTQGFIHILDPAELLRVVQAAEMIFENSTTLTKMMCFDYYLVKRAEVIANNPSLIAHVLFRREEASGGMGTHTTF
jgi:hypothetical protein